MKKDKKWLKDEVKVFQEGENMFTAEFNAGVQDALEYVQELIDQLDEPEVKQLDKKIKELESYNDELIRDNNQLRNQLDEPKKPVIPQFVAVWIEKNKKQSESLVFAITHIYYKNEIGKSPNKEEERIFQWMELADNEEVFARAWLDGYEVEKEKLYHVVNEENYFMLRKDDGLVLSMQVSPAMSRKEFGKDTRFMLTKKEIKNYDKRYWAFAEEVTE